MFFELRKLASSEFGTNLQAGQIPNTFADPPRSFGQRQQSFEIVSELVMPPSVDYPQRVTAHNESDPRATSDEAEERIKSETFRSVQQTSLYGPRQSPYSEVIQWSETPTIRNLYHKGELKTQMLHSTSESSLLDSISVIKYDITRIRADAIVNATNVNLEGGGVLDEHILLAGGPELRAAYEELGACAIGDALITPGYKLPCNWVIHTVPPELMSRKNLRERLLRSCYRNCLVRAKEMGVRSIVFPCMGTGRNGYPNEETAIVAASAVREFLQEPDNDCFDRIIFCVYQQEDEDAYRAIIP
jgi:O-acetyl-ADP-ribose deacetylase